MKQILVFIVFIAAVFVAGCTHDRPLGGPWVMVLYDTLGDSGSGSAGLFEVVNGKRILVDEIVVFYRVYKDGECIVYSTTRNGRTYAACAGKQPILLNKDSVRVGPYGWDLLDCGVATVEAANNVNDPRVRFVFRVDDFVAAARKQPPISPGWPSRSVQVMEPTVMRASSDCFQHR